MNALKKYKNKKVKEENFMIRSESTTLFLITAYNSETRQENIIFANFKEELLSEKKDIELVKKIKVYKQDNNIYNQRFYIGEKSKIKKKYKELIKNKKITLGKEEFYLNCKLLKKIKAEDIHSIKGFERDKKYLATEYIYSDYDDLEETKFLSINKEFSNIFGGKIEKDFSSKIFPLRYITLKKLDQYIGMRVCLRYEKLFFISDLRGIEENKDLEPEIYEGIINYSPISLNELSMAILDKEEDILKISDEKWSKVNPRNGKWHYELDKRSAKGIIVYKNLKNNEIIAASKFALIMRFDININVMDATLIDLYGQEISFSKNNLEKPKLERSLESKTFFRESYPNYGEKEYSIEISKYLENFLESLGEEILVVDPYLLGKLKNLKINNSQAPLINAIFKILTKIQIKKIIFICSKQKVAPTNLNERKHIYQKDDYEKLIQKFKQIQKDVEIEIILHDTLLHDRYIIGLDSKKVISSSKSMNGLAKNGEVTFNILEKNTSKRIVRKYKEMVVE